MHAAMPGKMRKLYLETFGCQMNVLDSELVAGQLRRDGYEPTADRDEADVVIFNTCSVREHAEQKVWSRLGELKQAKEERPDLTIGVIGCMAERDGLRIFDRFPHVDLLCGPGELDKLATLVSERDGQRSALMGSTARRTSTRDAAEDNLELLDLSRATSPADVGRQAYVRITRGCNKFCTYCVVPYTRGPEVHRPPSNIVAEVQRLVDGGAIEVTLLGQTINHYAFDHGDGRTTTFADLLYQIHEAVPALPRLRFVTSYPRDFTDEALDAMRDCDRICRYLHVPAQHGSDRLLKAMNRGYTIGQYEEFIGRAKEKMPDVSLASDFIVGFPTETEAEYETCRGVVERCGFKNSFVFKYSPRPGTVAIKRFEDDVSEEDKRRRCNDLIAVQNEVTKRGNQELVGRRLELMVEGPSKHAAKAYPASNVTLGSGFNRRAAVEQLVGRTRGDQIVVFDGDPALAGSLADVDVVEAKGLTLF
ncbi:MAG: tRNA (N6-isopentenyl adenosine(37)-C2)-methylthiotransferase MiaB, partial [Planctomycetota bacterium]